MGNGWVVFEKADGNPTVTRTLIPGTSPTEPGQRYLIIKANGEQTLQMFAEAQRQYNAAQQGKNPYHLLWNNCATFVAQVLAAGGFHFDAGIGEVVPSAQWYGANQYALGQATWGWLAQFLGLSPQAPTPNVYINPRLLR